MNSDRARASFGSVPGSPSWTDEDITDKMARTESEKQSLKREAEELVSYSQQRHTRKTCANSSSDTRSTRSCTGP